TIEGDIGSGQSVVVIEDLISTGGSSLKAVEALREKECIVKGLVAIFTYGFDESVQAFKKAKCQMETLTDYATLIETALNKDLISDKDIQSLNEWRVNPKAWSERKSK